MDSYYNTGMQHSKAAAGFGTALSEVAKSVENDKDISEPIMKVFSQKLCQQAVLEIDSLSSVWNSSLPKVGYILD